MKIRKDKGQKHKQYKLIIRRKDHRDKQTQVKLRYDVFDMLLKKQDETGLSKSELINNALWVVFCNNKSFFRYEMQRHLMNAEVYRHKLEAERLSKAEIKP